MEIHIFIKQLILQPGMFRTTIKRGFYIEMPTHAMKKVCWLGEFDQFDINHLKFLGQCH